MVDEKYLIVAKGLAERNRNRLNTELSPKEKERNRLFFWLMSRLEWSIEQCWPAKKSHNVIVKEISKSPNYVSLSHGRVSEYLSQYVARDEFLSVMQDVTDIFNEIGKRKEDKYELYAIFTAEGENIKMAVKLTTKD